jgi:hypothetical protein
MNHFAIISMSIRKPDFPYTCPGLGDRVHSLLIAYQYGKKHGFPVTVHITLDKHDKKKPQSWKEILSLFPPGSLKVMAHPIKAIPDKEWRAYLRHRGWDCPSYCYGDSPHRLDRQDADLDISEYLRDLPRLSSPLKDEADLPEKFLTCQWDAVGTNMSRRLGKKQVEGILQRYRQDGYGTIQVGIDQSLREIGHLMSGADLHVGMDSGMMHMAMLYMDYEQLHIYRSKFVSHHAHRVFKNGGKADYHA